MTQITRQQRLFFAVWPEVSVREELAAVIRNFKPMLAAHWIRPENLHITLAFLGEVEAGRLDAAHTAATAIHAPAFHLSLDRIEHWRKPQVLCLTPSASCDPLQRLAGDLASRLQIAGFNLDERPFRAHLTLARKALRLPENIHLEQAIVWRSEAFVLVESRQDGRGSCYTPIQSWPLLSATSLER